MKYSHLVLGLSALYALIFSYLSLTKYVGGGYTGSDLAIFNQVLWNLVNGGVGVIHESPIHSSIQGHSYFGDHFAPILLLLAPVYALWQDPRWLLILQSIVLGLTAVPIFYITRHVGTGLAPALRENRHPQGEPLHDRYVFLFTIIWLLNPLLHNINLFEFHVLPFALLFFLCTIYYYWVMQNQGTRKGSPYSTLFFVVFLVLALLVREDVALVVTALGVVIVIDWYLRRGRWSSARTAGLAAVIVGMLWFMGAQFIIGQFSPSGGYQFASYYSWITTSSFTGVLGHVFSFSNFNLSLAVLLPFLFLPLARPRWLLLAAPPALAAFLAASSGSVVWQSHLVALWLPGMVIGSVFAYTHLIHVLQTKKLEPAIVPIILVAGVVLSSFALGPKIVRGGTQNFEPLQVEISQGASVVATYQHLVPLSSRAEIYDLRYIWLGHQQYSSAPYIYRDPEYVVIAQQDLESYMVQFPTLAWTAAAHKQGEDRLRGLIANGGYEVVEHSPSVLVFKKTHLPTTDATLAALDGALEQAREVGERCSGGVEILPDRSVGLVMDSCHNGEVL